MSPLLGFTEVLPVKMNSFFGSSKRSDEGLIAPRMEADLLEVGRMAQARGDSAMAFQLWEKHRSRNPADPAGYLLAASLLKSQKQLDAAESLLKEGLGRCAGDIPLALEYAGVAHERADWPEAVKRWKGVLDKFPFHPIAAGGLVTALVNLELYDHAEALLVTMRKVFPKDYYFAVQSALVVTKRQSWSEALVRWDSVKALKPDCELASGHIKAIKDIQSSSLEVATI